MIVLKRERSNVRDIIMSSLPVDEFSEFIFETEDFIKDC